MSPYTTLRNSTLSVAAAEAAAKEAHIEAALAAAQSSPGSRFRDSVNSLPKSAPGFEASSPLSDWNKTQDSLLRGSLDLSRPSRGRGPSPVRGPQYYAPPLRRSSVTSPTSPTLNRPMSLPPGARPSTNHYVLSPSSLKAETPRWKREAERQSAKVVLELMAQFGQVEGDLEAARVALSTSFPSPHLLESAYQVLDPTGKLFVPPGALRNLVADFGGTMSVQEMGGFLRELRLHWSWDDPAAAALLVNERLSFRDVALLICRVDSPEYQAVRDAKTDDEARSSLYILQNTEPCPKCGIRVQRDADAAGCPSVTCPVCYTSFRCFCVMGDRGAFAGTPKLPIPAQYQLSRLISLFAKSSVELEQARRRTTALLSYDGKTLGDAFGALTGVKASLTLTDLKNALFEHSVPLSEPLLMLLWRRFAVWKTSCSVLAAASLGFKGDGVSLPDFRRQLQQTPPAWG
mmetsp:Transcript_68795/g.150342  ORF Transcript_68795/g.150342 Transcript_68795/m.150342 type:complete len:460 (-) Transcript_68795:369-1748(-)